MLGVENIKKFIPRQLAKKQKQRLRMEQKWNITHPACDVLATSHLGIT